MTRPLSLLPAVFAITVVMASVGTFAQVSTNGKTAKIMSIWDGWNGTMRYLDYNAFTSDGPLTIGAFHTIEVTS